MKRDEVAAFAARYDPDPPHARQVERLSLLLFDALAPLHRLGEAEREVLSSAALLHDIGWVGGVQGHHKRSCLMVLEDKTLPFSDEERTLVALVARYHRRALPARKHPLFAALSPEDQATVSALAAILRVADGLDVGHAGAVAGLACTLGEEAVTVALTPCGPVDAEVRAAEKKGDLFRAIYRRDLVVRPREQNGQV
ncbi:metal dependent phosphohydrolase [Methanofollis liminatans DSM 4140]|uniref:Metal dependent phosphohydrolase n=1 Tax=Methanofollis liminatans DSM 4140 TaxID=28892 RepID=J1KZH0_9EURY|nr:HD domain-containing protein [Methanofollis liminatans]EJG06132.1 metal dependent phosphohydrolase [Methanofollis liminatans DSM 4140]